MKTNKKQPIPLGARLHIQLDELNLGDFKVTMATAVEVGTVIAVGNAWNHEEEPVKVGDRVHFKSWALDCITEGTERFYYLAQQTKGLCAVLK